GRPIPPWRPPVPRGPVNDRARLHRPALPAAPPPPDPPGPWALTCEIAQLDRIPARVRSLISHLARTYACLRVCAHSGHSVWRTHYNGEGYTRPRRRA